MMTVLTLNETKDMLLSVCDRIISEKPLLTRLDGRIGDGDHGIGMRRGMLTAKKNLMDAVRIGTAGDLFAIVGRSMISSMGGASGVVFGTMFLGAAKGQEGAEELSPEDFIKMMRRALTETKKRGKAVPGDKTMVDALEPAVAAMEALYREKDLSELDFETVFAVAVKASKEGAEATRGMMARHGHAKTLYERSLGHPDPGAVSVYLIFDQMACWAALKGE